MKKLIILLLAATWSLSGFAVHKNPCNWSYTYQILTPDLEINYLNGINGFVVAKNSNTSFTIHSAENCDATNGSAIITFTGPGKIYSNLFFSNVDKNVPYVDRINIRQTDYKKAFFESDNIADLGLDKFGLNFKVEK